MEKKILIKWICITLMCAIVFSALGFGYGQMVSSTECDKLLKMQASKCEFIGNDITGTITNKSRFDFDYIRQNMLENFTVIPE